MRPVSQRHQFLIYVLHEFATSYIFSSSQPFAEAQMLVITYFYILIFTYLRWLRIFTEDLLMAIA